MKLPVIQIPQILLCKEQGNLVVDPDWLGFLMAGAQQARYRTLNVGT